MKNKINNIKRFLTLLFTDRDLSEEVDIDTQQTISSEYRDTEPEWIAEPLETITLEEEKPDFFQITPENVGPEREEVMTKILSEPLEKTTSTVNETIKNTSKVSKMPSKYDETSLLLGLTPEQDKAVSIDTEALKRHMLVIGMTGSGKTTMLERMILQDIDAGRGV